MRVREWWRQKVSRVVIQKRYYSFRHKQISNMRDLEWYFILKQNSKKGIRKEEKRANEERQENTEK